MHSIREDFHDFTITGKEGGKHTLNCIANEKRSKAKKQNPTASKSKFSSKATLSVDETLTHIINTVDESTGSFESSQGSQ